MTCMHFILQEKPRSQTNTNFLIPGKENATKTILSHGLRNKVLCFCGIKNKGICESSETCWIF